MQLGRRLKLARAKASAEKDIKTMDLFEGLEC